MNTLYNHKRIIFIVMILIFALSSNGQNPMKGKSFWMGFLRNFYVSDTIYLNLYITSDVATSGVVNVPLLGWSQQFNVTPGNITTINIPSNLFPNGASGTTTNSGVQISAHEEISVYAANSHSVTSDGSFILPNELLKTDYFVMTYPGYLTNPSDLCIVATENNTTIEVTPSTNTQEGKPADVPFNITLNAGQVYHLKSENGKDLTGTRVRGYGSCKNFAVFSGAIIANIPSDCPFADHIYHQMIPNEYLGKKYFLAPISGVSYSCKVLATENNTTIRFNAGQTIVLNAGQAYTWNSLTAPMEFSANRPIMVAQFLEGMACAGKGDPAMAIISPYEQKQKEFKFSTAIVPNINDHNLNVVMKTAHTNQLRINGVNSGNGFTAFPNAPDYSYKMISLPQSGTYRLQADSGIVASVYGFGDYNSYFYSAGILGETNLVDFAHDPLICQGTPVTFSGIGQGMTSWTWQFPENITEEGRTVNYSFANPGNQKVSLTVGNPSFCPQTITKTVYVNPAPSVQFAKDTILCENSVLKINTQGNALKYLWSTGDTTSSIETNKPGTYWLKTSNGTCTKKDTITIHPLKKPIVSLGNDKVFCDNENLTLKTTTTAISDFIWSTGEFSDEITVDREGTYWVEASNVCGSSTDTITVKTNPAPQLNFSPDTTILIGTTAKLFASGSESISWSPAYKLSCTNCPSTIAKPEETTTYYITGTNQWGCTTTEKVTVEVDPNLAVFVPNIFSPNGDGQNDVLYVRGKGVKDIKFMLYNRWGERVFETNNLYVGWDGTFRGKQLPPSVYVYYLEAILETDQVIVLKGDVTLIR